MARARNVKPGLFKNEHLTNVSMAARLLFIGLWTLADREGRLEDRPLKIKMELFPIDVLDINDLLNELAQSPGKFITRYTVDGEQFIQIENFKKHQKPHPKEPPSEIAPPPEPCNSTERNFFPRQDLEIPEQAAPLTHYPTPLTDTPTTEPMPQKNLGSGSGVFFEIENNGQSLTEDEWIYRNLMEHRRNKGWKSEGAHNLQSLLTLYPNHLDQFRNWVTHPMARRIAAFAYGAIKVTPDNHFKYALKMARDGTGEDFEKFLYQAQKQVDEKDYLVRING